MGKNILFLLRSLDIGGAERQLVELAEGLQRSGWRVKVATFYGGGALESDLVGRGVGLHVIGKRGRWDMIGFSRRLCSYLREERPDFLHGYLVVPNILTVLLKPMLSRTRIVWGVR